MYRIILVDDEAEVRQGISKKIDFNELGFQLVGEAENGVDALELIDKENPDVAIIDIKMPYMDGIELSREIYQKYPAIKVIILSGFDEFEFAQKAIRYHVMDYVLKPITSENIVTLLKKTKLTLDELKDKRQNFMRLEKHYNDSLPIIRDRYLNALIRGDQNVIDIKDKLSRLKIEVNSDFYLTAIVKPDKTDELRGNTYDIYAFGILETCTDLLENEPVILFQNHFGSTVIIFTEKEVEWLHALEEIRAVIEKQHNQTVTIGVGNAVNDFEAIKLSYQEANQALNYKLIEGQNRILWINDLEPERKTTVCFDDYSEAFSQVIRSGQVEEIPTAVTNIMNSLQVTSLSLEDIELFVVEMLVFLLRLSRTYELTLEWFKGNKDIHNILSQHESFESLSQLIVDLSLQVSQGIMNTRKNSIKLLIESTVLHIEEHYHKNISLESVADHHHISSEYLSRQFKKEMNETFIHYLTRLRLTHAKRLIEDTNLKNFEIAEKVGYPEPNYFSYVYKKFYGISPSKYRKTVKGSIS